MAFVPENRLGHSAVPELTLSENILLSQFPNNKLISIFNTYKKKKVRYNNSTTLPIPLVLPSLKTIISSISINSGLYLNLNLMKQEFLLIDVLSIHE